ncbi:NAD-dependent deacylase [Roseomonas sp. CCTCC AB2023176]|uniref:NAD-dependent deacylase n=1 Tax=Roseomonas sp. CCTCC AB2023176 TaxID=3342640 RepID=UPI0035DD6B20
MAPGARPPNIVVLTGAGISRESGLHTFRDPEGIWAQVRIEDVATPEAFARDPACVQAFYDARRMQLRNAGVEPNAAHRALAELEARWPGGFLLVTQNVDDLHGRAGSRRLIAMHGELAKARCLTCHAVVVSPDTLADGPACPACGVPGRLRPHVVWFGEMPLEMERIGEALSVCDLFVSIGTSGAVYPAAGFVAEVRGRAETLELNLEPSEGTRLFDEARHGPATRLVPQWVGEVMARWR